MLNREKVQQLVSYLEDLPDSEYDQITALPDVPCCVVGHALRLWNSGKLLYSPRDWFAAMLGITGVEATNIYGADIATTREEAIEMLRGLLNHVP